MSLFQQKYRIDSARLKNWDYATNATYFITICVKDMAMAFGQIINGDMYLNDLGTIANNEWQKTAEIRADMNLKLDAFVVMPNHFHAIIAIGENRYNSSADPDKEKGQFGPQAKNLASIVRGYKSAVSREAKAIYPDFKWQAKYHDHIIRDEESYIHIHNYIINNPLNWQKDKFYMSK